MLGTSFHKIKSLCLTAQLITWSRTHKQWEVIISFHTAYICNKLPLKDNVMLTHDQHTIVEMLYDTCDQFLLDALKVWAHIWAITRDGRRL